MSTETITPGNAAAMYEALRTLRQKFNNNVMAYQDRYFKFSGWHWHKKAAEAAKWRDVFYELLEVCDAALAKPPRECDRFGSYAEARAEWWKFEVLPRVAGVVSGTEQPFDEWLFAPAKEGGAK